MINRASFRILAALDETLSGVQNLLTKIVGWFNAAFTVTSLSLNVDETIKILGFLIVTIPLGILQWANLVTWWKNRKKKKNAETQDGGPTV